MNKELFVSTMEKIEELHREQERFNDMLRSIDSEFGGGYIHNKTINLLEDLLVKLVNDKYGNISYYMWEIDFGKGYEDGMITAEDGSIIRLSNPSELYDLIVEENADDESELA